MAFIFVGYLPKVIVSPSAEMALPARVAGVWSVSNCISAAPPAWFERWEHNRFGAFDTVEGAWSLVPEDTASAYAMLALRIWHEDRASDGWQPVDFAGIAAAPPPTASTELLGFDAVNHSGSDAFECSPLSCNGGARECTTNAQCLFATLGDALAGAEYFAGGGWEPGPYYVVEVSRIQPHG